MPVKPITVLSAALISAMMILNPHKMHAGSSPFDNPELTRLRNILEKQGYSPDMQYVKGRYIQVPGIKAEFKRLEPKAFPYKWNFDNGTDCGLGKALGIKNLLVKDGKLAFTTGAGSSLAWGTLAAGKKPLRIGFDITGQCRNYRYPKMTPMAIRVRMRQSLPESTWKAAVRTSPAANVYAMQSEKPKRVVTGSSGDVIVKGTEWQTVVLSIPYTRGKGKVDLQPPYDGVRISTSTPGNKIEIDWVDMAVQKVSAQFRKVINIPAKVRWAKISVSAFSNYRIYVNGKRVVPDHYPAVMYAQLWNREIDPKLFKPGKNVIAVDCPALKENFSAFMLDGALLCEDGSYLRFDSGEDWKANQWQSGKTWMLSGYDDSAWKKPAYYERLVKHDIFSYWFNPSYKGQIAVCPGDGRSEPVFGSREVVKLNIEILGKSPQLSYRVIDEMGDYFEIGNKEVDKGIIYLKQQGSVWIGKIILKNLAANHAYAVDLQLKDSGKTVETRRYEIAVCGPVRLPKVKNPKTYTDGMKLKLVWESDPTAELSKDKVLCCDFRGREIPLSKTSVVDTSIGKWRQTPVGERALLSFKYTIQNPGRPHVVIADYPADSFRCQSIRMEDCMPELAIRGRLRPALPIMQLGNDGYQLGGYNPLTHTVNQHHVLFFPNKNNGFVSFMTWFPMSCLRNRRSAEDKKIAVRVGKIRIYEILNDVPEKIMPETPGDYKCFGQQTERGPSQILQSCFQAPAAAYFKYQGFSNTPYFYRNWMVSYINLIKRMKFDGTNTHYLGQFMYSGTLHPGKWSFGTNLAYNQSGSLRNYGILMARMMHENNMGWFSCLELMGLPCFIPEYSDEEIRSGAETLAQVTKDGKKMQSFTANGQSVIIPNWIHPKVRKQYENYIDEQIRLYGIEKGWKGVLLSINEVLGPAWFSLRDPYLTSYDDYTIGLFEKETGVKIPVKKTDRNRFPKRYKWLMDNAKPQWTKWRCDKMNGIYQWTAKRLKQARPDLKLIVYPQAMNYIVPKPGQKTARPIYDYGKRCGMDLKWLKDNPDIILSMNVQCTNRNDRRESVFRDECLIPFANDTKNGVAVRYNWTEIDLDWPKRWGLCQGHKLWNHTTVETWMHAPGNYFGDYYVNALARSNPSMVVQPLSDIALWQGHELELSRIAAGYLSLPNAKYSRLTGKGRDKNLWIQVARFNGDIYGYIVNPQWWKAKIRMKLSPGTEIISLINGKAIKAPELKLLLKPYAMATFKVKGAKDLDVIKSCEFTIDKNDLDKVNKLLDGYAAAAKNDAGKSLVNECRKAIQNSEYNKAWKQMLLTKTGIELYKSIEKK